MGLYQQIALLFGFTCLFIASHGQSPNFDEDALVHSECVKANCPYPTLCYIPHPRNCFKFIMCRQLEMGQVISQAMPCAFGTMWSPHKEGACDRYDLVDCPNDKCRDGTLSAYPHPDNNCRTYWRCENGLSKPACCEMYHRFDPQTNTCVYDETCESLCPLLNDATCTGVGVQYTNFADGNCKTHWDCENGHPHPVCCPDGQGFDAFTSTCIPDATCTDLCPKEYSESCSMPGTVSYDVEDDNCRTYIKCENGTANPSCCLSKMMYSPEQRQCVDAVGMSCINAGCPAGYVEACRMKPVPGNNRLFKNLDAFGGLVQPCAVGTVYSHKDCNCIVDPKASLPSARPTGCSIAIDAQFPDLKNLGSVVATLLKIGKYGQGETGVGNMTAFWDGQDGITIPYYGSQALHRLYLQARLTPTAGSQQRQIFASSCSYDQNGEPTFEISLSDFTSQGGNIYLVASNGNAVPEVARLSVPYQFNTELVLTVIFDGSKIGFFVSSGDGMTSLAGANQLTGLIQIDISGLRFAHCRYETDKSSFIGYVSQIQFTKCLTPEMKDLLNSATLSGQIQPVVNTVPVQPLVNPAVLGNTAKISRAAKGKRPVKTTPRPEVIETAAGSSQAIKEKVPAQPPVNPEVVETPVGPVQPPGLSETPAGSSQTGNDQVPAQPPVNPEVPGTPAGSSQEGGDQVPAQPPINPGVVETPAGSADTAGGQPAVNQGAGETSAGNSQGRGENVPPQQPVNPAILEAAIANLMSGNTEAPGQSGGQGGFETTEKTPLPDTTVTTEAVTDIPVETPAEIPAEIPGETPAEIPAENPAGPPP